MPQTHDAATELANLVLSMAFVSAPGLHARQLARRVLGVEDHGKLGAFVPINTNGRIRLVPRDEPVFLIRGQDELGADVVRHWADLAGIAGASVTIVQSARAHAAVMDAWPVKKLPDLPGVTTRTE